MIIRRASVLLMLVAVEALAIRTMWMGLRQNGTHAKMVHLRDFGPHLIPGSNIPLKKVYIGIHSIDYYLTVLQLAFANVVDGSSPGVSLFSFQFSGTLLAAIVVVWTESLKSRSPIRSQVL